MSEVAAEPSGRRSLVDRFDAFASPAVVAFLPALVTLGVAVYQLSRPHALTGVLGYNVGYDDGVYLGVTTKLVHGIVPYRDFVYVHPPGIAVLLAPVGLLGRVIGTHDAMVVARCLTVLVVAANVGLAGLAVRHAGRLASFVAASLLALWPLTVSVTRTVELEPYLVLFCLLGAVLMFQEGVLAGNRRLLVAGAAFGLAFDMKVWAVLPIAAALLACVPRWRKAGVLAGGTAAGVLVVSLPFFVLSPRAFWHDVVVAQMQRQNLFSATPLTERLRLMTGVTGLSDVGGRSALAVGLLVVLVVASLFLYGWRSWQRSRADWFVLVSVVVVVAGMFRSPNFFDHYAYFTAPFFAMLAGLCAGHLAAAVGTRRRWPAYGDVGSRGRRNVLIASGAVVALLAGFVVVENARYASAYVAEASDPAAAIAQAIPVGACVLSDYPSDLLMGERYPTSSNCPSAVDPFGLYLARDHGSQPHLEPPPYDPAFEQEWFGWLQRANFLEIRIPFGDFIPWSPEMIAWFNQHYRLVAHDSVVYDRPFIDATKDMYIYENLDRPLARASTAAGANAQIDAGLAAQRAGDDAGALAHFRRAVNLDRTNPIAYYDLGVVLQRLGQRQKAADAYRSAITIDPGYKSALFNLAILESTEHPDMAVQLYRRLLQISPHDPNVEFNLGLLLVRQGQEREGRRLLREAVRLDPTLADRLPSDVHIG